MLRVVAVAPNAADSTADDADDDYAAVAADDVDDADDDGMPHDAPWGQYLLP